MPVWIDSRYVEADLKITTGLIEPHLMAGFSGGRKLVCPGIAALETVKVWHGPDFLEHPKADCGILDGNPVHEENTWIARMAGCDFIVNVDDRHRPPRHVARGRRHGAGVPRRGRVRRRWSVGRRPRAGGRRGDELGRLSARHDVLPGGQGAHRLLPIVKQGGTIIMAASLTEGIGSPEFPRSSARTRPRRLHRADPGQGLFRARPVATRRAGQGVPQGQAAVRYVRTIARGVCPNSSSIRPPASNWPSPKRSPSTAPDTRVAVVPKGPYVLPVVAA